MKWRCRGSGSAWHLIHSAVRHCSSISGEDEKENAALPDSEEELATPTLFIDKVVCRQHSAPGERVHLQSLSFTRVSMTAKQEEALSGATDFTIVSFSKFFLIIRPI